MREPLIQYGIFWIPSRETTVFMQEAKERLAEFEPTAKYLNHPVHATLFLFMGEKKFVPSYIELLHMVCKNTPLFKIQYGGWKIFEKDQLTKANTVTLAISASPELSSLQTFVVKCFAQMRKEAVPYAVEWKDEFEKSYKEFGYPFVGAHWQPHLTAASMPWSNEMIMDTLNQLPTKPRRDKVGSLCLYRIQNDEHQLLKQIEFGK
jgi:hypothetical protein